MLRPGEGARGGEDVVFRTVARAPDLPQNAACNAAFQIGAVTESALPAESGTTVNRRDLMRSKSRQLVRQHAFEAAGAGREEPFHQRRDRSRFSGSGALDGIAQRADVLLADFDRVAVL